MITEKDLQEAIAECKGIRNPNASTCIKLAAFYIIQEHMFGGKEVPAYSFAPGKDTFTQREVEYESDTEFGRAISGMGVNEVMSIIDELMTALSVVNPRLYAGVIRKIAG